MISLGGLIACYDRCRAYGHTYAMIHGIVGLKEVIVILGTRAQEREVKAANPKATVLTLDSGNLADAMRGRICPIVIDHYALQLMLDEYERVLLRNAREIKRLNKLLEKHSSAITAC